MIRILDPRSTLSSFEQLGLASSHLESLRRLVALPQGMLIVTGPQGAGKTTSLYAALNLSMSSSRDTITIEDPVENIIDGVTQVQVDARAGLSMAAALRPILRQNPSVVVIGEIRDGETAEIALRASQTGHLVLATLQATDSVGAISRLREMGIAPNLIASISGVIGQRLLRTLCVCAKKVPATPAYVQAFEAMIAKNPPTEMLQPGGCSACDHSGYKGRIGIFETLNVDGMVRDAIHADSGADAIRALLRSGGFARMQDDALDKVLQGATTLDEVLRVVPFDSTLDRLCGQCGHRQTPGFRFCPFCGVSANS
jgi:type II secretory ATPase GspE/PulE/Tfp pilus assembly ATPase PilB-like protein